MFESVNSQSEIRVVRLLSEVRIRFHNARSPDEPAAKHQHECADTLIGNLEIHCKPVAAGILLYFELLYYRSDFLSNDYYVKIPDFHLQSIVSLCIIYFT